MLKSVDAVMPKSKSRKILESGHKGRIHKCLTFSLNLVSSIRERYLPPTGNSAREKASEKTLQQFILEKMSPIEAYRAILISRNII